MAADAISLYVDLSTPQGALVRGLNDRSAFVLGPFYQSSLLQLRIYPVAPTGNQAIAPFFSKLPLTNLDVRVAIGPAAGGEAIKAAQYVWTKQLVPDADGASGYFYADLDLNTTDLNNLVSTNAEITTQFEIALARGAGTYRPVFQQNIIVRPVVKDPGSAASIPTPTADYYTAAQIRQLFVPWDNRLFNINWGRAPIFVSPDGSHTREAPGVDNDGAPTDNLT